MIQNTWKISSMECYPSRDDKTNLVFMLHWRLTGTEASYVGSVYGSQNIELSDEEEFTPYENLTEEQVIGWLKNAIGADAVAAHENNVASQIETQKNPPIISPTLPWTV